MRLTKFLATAAALAVTSLATLVVQPASAVGPTTLYVARTGSVGNGSSCSSPGYVGATHVAIQAALNAASTGDTV